MKRICVEGGWVLKGEVKLSGSKNAALAILPAALLCSGECVIHNVPDIADIRVMLELMRSAGAKCQFDGGTVVVNASDLSVTELPEDLVRNIRASIYMLGGLLSRTGGFRMARPGGCNLNRRVNFHIDALTRMGAIMEVDSTGDWVYAFCKDGRLHGAEIELDPRWRSVGTTVNIMLAASLADGVTVIRNAAREPEVVNCASFLKAMGAMIKGEGTSTIVIEGVNQLRGCEFHVINDRIEAGTFLLAGAITGGRVEVGPINSEWLAPVIEKLSQAGVKVEVKGDWLQVECDRRPCGVSLTTEPYPGFPTDLQPPFVSLLSIAEGKSVVTETIHEGRLRYCSELRRMGAQIEVSEPDVSHNGELRLPSVAIVEGVEALYGAEVYACDLRAGAALTVAGLAAYGETVIQNAEAIERGYERFVEKLDSLGAKVKMLCEVEVSSQVRQ
ncbi:MAG: UDP-N-acetylglucosamine 1-carboxyvinyltransferase [Armatimonadetes bacterium]|nr:UDP-N-acetylglucosamine 1-carboxyvinyltransferase [Armatimonadota bacterium]